MKFNLFKSKRYYVTVECCCCGKQVKVKLVNCHKCKRHVTCLGSPRPICLKTHRFFCKAHSMSDWLDKEEAKW